MIKQLSVADCRSLYVAVSLEMACDPPFLELTDRSCPIWFNLWGSEMSLGTLMNGLVIFEVRASI